MELSRRRHDHDHDHNPCCLCRLHEELLKIILNYLSVVDYIKFRAVCKCWSSAFSDCAASFGILSQKYPERELPWCLPSKAVSAERTKFSYTRPILHTSGMLGSLSRRRIYTTDIPELCGARIVLSKFGWLLLFNCSNQGNFDSSEIYFFNPFSKAKIVLPFMDVSKLVCPVFDLSAPPTSPDCMIFVASFIEPVDVKIDVCIRGDSTWTSYRGTHLCSIINSVFANGIWYLQHAMGGFTKFDVVNRRCDVVYVKDFDISFSSLISYPVRRDEQIFIRIHALECYEIELSNSLRSLVAREVDYFDRNTDRLDDFIFQDSEFLFRTQVEKAIVKERGVVSIDSFNIDAWCGEFDADGAMMVRWHRFVSYRAAYCRLHEDAICHVKNDCSTFVMWFEPVWVQPSPNLSWF